MYSPTQIFGILTLLLDGLYYLNIYFIETYLQVTLHFTQHDIVRNNVCLSLVSHIFLKNVGFKIQKTNTIGQTINYELF